MKTHIGDRKQSAQEIGDLVFELLANCQQKEEILARQFRISVPEFRCLRMFRGNDETTIKTLTERMMLSGSRLTRIIDALEEKEFLTRMFNDEDRRSIMLRLTKKGSAIARQLEDRYVRIHEEILHNVPLDEQVLLTGGLRQLLSSLVAWLRQA